MVEIRDGKKVLITPISREDLNGVHIGDVIYLDGDLTTCRDVAHRRLVEEGRPLPVGVRDCAILHAGPPLSVRLRMTSLRWFLSAPPPPCAWKSSRKSLSI